MSKIKKCDMCGTAIDDLGKCSCGTWIDKDKLPDSDIAMQSALEAFHDMKRMTLTTEIPHLGVACVYFRGDYTDCKEVEYFICKMKGRPYYEE